MKLILLFTLIATTQATVYLTTDNFDEMTQGKRGLVAFKAPWCGHCKKLKPVWDKLSDAVDVMVAEVDCTKEQSLCQKHGVKGYPTLKYSDGFGWKSYDNGRDYNSLEKFIEEHLQEGCFEDPNLCTEDELEKIEKVKKLTESEVETFKNTIKEQLATVESTFQKAIKILQSEYKKLSGDKTLEVQTLNAELGYLNYASTLKEEL
jgi:protein disulfide-isomerase-like protein